MAPTVRNRFNGLIAGTLRPALAAGLDNVQTTITFPAALNQNDGGAIPTLADPYYITLTLDPDTSSEEIVWLTAYTSGATTGTILRGQENTVAVAHSVGAVVVHSPTVYDYSNTGPQAAGNVGLTVRGYPGQTADLYQVLNSAGSVLAKIDASGNVVINSANTGFSVVSSGSANPFVATLNGSTLWQVRTSGGASFVENLAGPLYLRGSGTNALIAQASAASYVPLTVQGLASQTADLQQWQNSGGTVLSRIAAPGFMEFLSNGDVTGASGLLSLGYFAGNYGWIQSFGSTPLWINKLGNNVYVGGPLVLSQYIQGTSGNYLSFAVGAGLTAVPGAANQNGLIVKGVASQSADLQQWQNSAGTVLANVSSAGAILAHGTSGSSIQIDSTSDNPTIYIIGSSNGYYPAIDFRPLGLTSVGGIIQSNSTAGGIIVSGRGTGGSSLRVIPAQPGQVTLLVGGAGSQTADLTQWQNTNTPVLSRIDANGQFQGYGTNLTLANLGVPAGVAAALAAGGSLVVGTAYSYVVTATNGQGETTASATVSATPTAGNQSITITWNQVLGATGYKVYHVSATPGLQATITNGLTTSYTDTNASVSAGAAPTTPTGTKLVVQAWQAQSGNLQEWQDSTGTVRASVSNAGHGLFDWGGVGGTVFSINRGGSGAVFTVNDLGRTVSGPLTLSQQLGDTVANVLTVTSAVASGVAMYVRGAASQTADLTQWQGNAGNVVAGVTQAGAFYSIPATNSSFGGNALANVTLAALTSNAVIIPFVAQGAASQTGDLTQWRNSAGTVLAKVSAVGVLNVGNSTNSVASGGDVIARRSATQGVYYFGDSGSTYLYFDGTNFNASGGPFASLSSAGDITGSGNVYAGGGSNLGFGSAYFQRNNSTGVVTFVEQNYGGAGLVILSGVSSTVPLTAKGAASQTSDLQQWQNSAGTVLAKVDANGNITSGAAGATRIDITGATISHFYAADVNPRFTIARDYPAAVSGGWIGFGPNGTGTIAATGVGIGSGPANGSLVLSTTNGSGLVSRAVLDSLGFHGAGYLQSGTATSQVHYQDAASAEFNTSTTGAFIITTPIGRADSRMSRIRVWGYDYNRSAVIDFTVVFYPYGGSNGPDAVAGSIGSYSLVDLGNDGLNKYIGASGGKIVIAYGDVGTTAYYTRLSVEAWITQGTYQTAYDTGWSITGPNITANFGWSYAPILLGNSGGGFVTLGTSQTIAGAKTLNAGAAFTVGGYGEQSASAATGVYLGVTSSPRVQLVANGASNWEIDNSAGLLRFYQPGTVYAQMNTSGFQSFGTLTSSGYTYGTAGVYAGTSALTAYYFAVNSGSAGTVVAAIRGAASQTADLTQWQNSAGTVLAKVDASGNINVGALTSTGGVISGNGVIDFGPNATWGKYLRVGGNGSTDTTKASLVTTNGNLHLDPASGFSLYLGFYAGNNIYLGSGAGSYVGTINSAGNMRLGDATAPRQMLDVIGNTLVSGYVAAANGAIFGPETDTTSFVRISTNAASNKGLVVRGVASQTADLQQWQNSAGTVLLNVTAAGSMLYTAGSTGAGGSSVTLESQLASLRANNIMHGGGTVTFTGGNLLWNSRFIVISNGSGAAFSTVGYFDINMPASGTVITGVGGAANVTASASGIALAPWTALYYVLPIGSGNGTVNANFRIGGYTAAGAYPPEWILIAALNSDTGQLRLGTGATLIPGDTVTYGRLSGFNGTFTAGTLSTGVNASITTGGVGTFADLRSPYLQNAGGTAAYVDVGTLVGNTVSIIQRVAANVALNVQGAASQTGDLQQWRNSAAAVLGGVNADGVHNLSPTGGTDPVNGSSGAPAVGDKLSLYNGNGAGRYGLGIQSARIVAYVPSTAALAVRAAPATGQGSSGTDVITLFGDGHAVFTGAVTDSGGVLVHTTGTESITGVKTFGTTAAGLKTQNAAGTAPNPVAQFWQASNGASAASSYQAAAAWMYLDGVGDTANSPRLGFHLGGVVASQIGMDRSGNIRTYDNPGTGYAGFIAAGITTNGSLTATASVIIGPNNVTLTGNDSTYGALKVTGNVRSGYTGIRFAATTPRTFMVSDDGVYQGFYNEAASLWQWYFQNGVLNVGNVPAAQVIAGTFGSGNYNITGQLGIGPSGSVINAGVLVSPTNASYPVVVARGAASQTGDLLELQNSAGASVVLFNSSGSFTSYGATLSVVGQNTPSFYALSAAGAGGTFAAGTYYWVVTAVSTQGTSTVASAQVSQALTANQQQTLSWTASPGAVSYQIYRSTTSGTFGATSFLTNVTGTSYTDTGVATSSGSPPTSISGGSKAIVAAWQGQTGDLQTWQDSASNVLASVNSAGQLKGGLIGNYEAVQALGSVTGTVAISLGYNVVTMTLTGPTTLSLPNNGVGKTAEWTFVIAQDATGGRTLAMTGVKWPNGTMPSVSTAASQVDIWTVFTPDGTNFYGFQSGKAMA